MTSQAETRALIHGHIRQAIEYIDRSDQPTLEQRLTYLAGGLAQLRAATAHLEALNNVTMRDALTTALRTDQK